MRANWSTLEMPAKSKRRLCDNMSSFTLKFRCAAADLLMWSMQASFVTLHMKEWTDLGVLLYRSAFVLRSCTQVSALQSSRFHYYNRKDCIVI